MHGGSVADGDHTLNTTASAMSKQQKRLTKCIIYCRFSPRRHADDCESNETQLDYCRKYATRQGYEIVEVFADEELSGDDENRPGLWQAIDALKKGMVLITYKADRLARSVYLSEYLHREVRKRQATIEAVEGSRNGESPEDVFIRQVFAAFAELEKKVIAARTKSAMLRHQENGRAMSDEPPYGWRRARYQARKSADGKMERRMIEKDDAEQVVIRHMVTLRMNEGLGLRQIARRLQSEGVPCRGKSWTHVTVMRVLRREGIDLADKR